VEEALPRLVSARSFDDVDDLAAVMRNRIDRWVQVAGSERRAGKNLIAGLIPRAAGVTDTDMARGLQERAEALQRRAQELAERAIDQSPLWLRQLGARPSDPLSRERWLEAVKTSAAYRERWNINGNCSGLLSPSTPRVEGARIVGNSD